MSRGNAYSYLKHFLFSVVMATIPTTSQLSASTSSGTDEENKIGYETDLSAENTDYEIHADTSSWSTADRKKLQHNDRIPPGVSMCLWRGSLHLNHHKEKNISYESPYAQSHMPTGKCKVLT